MVVRRRRDLDVCVLLDFPEVLWSMENGEWVRL